MVVPFGCNSILPHPHLSSRPPPCQKTKFKNGQTIIDILMKFDSSTLRVSLHPSPPPSIIYIPPPPRPIIVQYYITYNCYPTLGG